MICHFRYSGVVRDESNMCDLNYAPLVGDYVMLISTKGVNFKGKVIKRTLHNSQSDGSFIIIIEDTNLVK